MAFIWSYSAFASKAIISAKCPVHKSGLNREFFHTSVELGQSCVRRGVTNTLLVIHMIATSPTCIFNALAWLRDEATCRYHIQDEQVEEKRQVMIVC